MAATSIKAAPSLTPHGAEMLPAVRVDCYNAELRSGDGFLGDRANKQAFADIIDAWRKRLRRLESDPLADVPEDKINRKQLEKVLVDSDNLEAAGLVLGAIEEFAGDLASVIKRFLTLKEWKGTERIVIGGGFSSGRIGELVIGRAGVILKGDGRDVDLVPIRNDPDHAGLLGAAQLAPPWIFSGHDSILAVDIGGTNIRAGLIELRLKKESDLSEARVAELERWRHADEEPSRKEAVGSLIKMLRKLIARARSEKMKLAPFIGIGCPGLIRDDGSIERGGQNLPGNWESERFNLPAAIHEAIPEIGDNPTAIVMHNDAVVQGLSEVPFMQDVKRWGVLTIGTGLGNARFTNRASL
ncbi:MAG: ROK family protein [Gemmatimonas sp.]